MTAPTRTHDEEIRRRRTRRAILCVSACIGVGAGAGAAHAFLLLIAIGIADAGGGASLAGILVAGGVLGAVYGVLGAAPFTVLVYRRPLGRACKLLFWSIVAISAVSAVATAIVAVVLASSGSARSGVGIGAILSLVFGSPLLGLGLGLAVIRRRVPRAWTPFPLGSCQSCGYDRDGLTPAAVCPECGPSRSPAAINPAFQAPRHESGLPEVERRRRRTPNLPLASVSSPARVEAGPGE